jgi:cell division septum initiation protein DivIVA
VDALLTEARRVPFSGSVMVNDEELMQLVDQVRLSLPDDMVQAHRILDERERVLRDTSERADELAERAEAAARLVGERASEQARELGQRARAEAEQVVARAQADARRLVEEAQAEAGRLVADHTVVRLAQERAAILLEEAEARAAQITTAAQAYARDADEYVQTVMTELEQRLVTATETVRKGLRTLAAPNPPAPRRGRGRGGATT